PRISYKKGQARVQDASRRSRAENMIEPGSQEELPLAQMPHRGDPAGRPRHGLVLTVGHSTRSLEEFIGLLRAHEVGLLADVRAFPRSRRNPQFNVDTLPEALRGAG